MFIMENMVLDESSNTQMDNVDTWQNLKQGMENNHWTCYRLSFR